MAHQCYGSLIAFEMLFPHLEALCGIQRRIPGFFTAPYPARFTVCGGRAQPGALIEIEAVAVVGARQTAIVATSP